mmetsp:Transcript_21578/g.54480  ORF Transcript_21578/g.54480 Transcript_21578/m.54480 type:complete len:864 (+) Transcript_21578:86-2677(+)|eukprot:g7262.t1
MEFLLFTAAAAGAEAATRSFSTTPDPLDVAPEPVSFQAFRKRFPPRQMPTVSPLETGTAFDYVRSAVTLVFMFVVLWTPCYVSLQILLSIYNKIVYGHAQGDPVEQQYYDAVESSAVSSEQKHKLREKRKPWGKATKTAVLVAVTALVASKQPLLWRAYAAQEFGIFYEWLRTVISPFNLYVHGASVVHYATVWMLSLPCLLCPLVPTLKKTKIQENKPPASWKDWVYVGVALFANVIFIQTPLALGLHFYVTYFKIPVTYEEIFTLEEVLPKLFCCMAIEDVFHYWGHYFFHTRMYWYKTVHKLHHSYPNPFGLEAELAHPIETMVLGTGFFVALHLNINHFLYILLWMWWRVCTTTDVHMGYHAPVFPWRYIVPFWTGVEHHDFHHRFFTANYAPSFEWWDRWMGTDEPYEKFLVGNALAQAANRLRKQEELKFGVEKYTPYLLRQYSEKDTKKALEGNFDALFDKYGKCKTQEEYSRRFAGEQAFTAPKSCAVTGGAGLVGQELVKLLQERGCRRINIVDLIREDGIEFVTLENGEKVTMEYFQADIGAADAVEKLTKAFSNCECVLHLAALVGPYFEHAQYAQVNVEGARNVLKACEAAGVKALVDVSSPSTRMDGCDIEGLDEKDLDLVQRRMLADGGFTHEYARTKAMGEKIILEAHGKSSVATCAVAPHQVYGEQDNLFLPNIVKNLPRMRQFGHDPMVLSFTHTTNIAHGTVLAARALLDKKAGVGGEFFLITDGVASSFWNRIDEAHKIAYPHAKASASIFRKLYVPKGVILAVAAVSHFFKYNLTLLLSGGDEKKAVKSSLLTPFAVNMLCIHRYLDASKAKHVLGYLPVVDGTEAWPKAVEAVAKRVVVAEK